MEKTMLDIDITYDIEKIDNFFDEEKIKEFVGYILKDEYKEEFDKNERVEKSMSNYWNYYGKIFKEYEEKSRDTIDKEQKI